MAEPFRQLFAAALARRAQAHEGALRERLDARLAGLRSPVDAGFEAPPQAPGLPPGRAALASLLQEIAARRGATSTAPATLPYFRRAWSRLHAEQRLLQSRAALPPNAGPLNSQHLVHRALALMRGLSPGYFERFVAHADTLLWLEQDQAQRRPPGGRRA